MESNKEMQRYYKSIFKDYPDIVKPKEIQKMLPKTGKNKIYSLLRSGEIYSKKIGRDYYIPKISIIKYLMEK